MQVAVWSRQLVPAVSFAVLELRVGMHQSAVLGTTAKLQCGGVLATDLQQKTDGRQHFLGTFKSRCPAMAKKARDVRRDVLAMPLECLKDAGAWGPVFWYSAERYRRTRCLCWQYIVG